MKEKNLSTETLSKQEIRSIMLSARNRMSSDEVREKSDRIRKRLQQEAFYQESTVILTYVSYQNEADTFAIISGAWNDGKKIYVPKAGMNGQMEFYAIQSYEELSPGFHGIMEPAGQSARFVPEEAPDGERLLFIVPGCAFDGEGNRIGYGGGYYDRYLSRMRTGTKIALAYDFQVIQAIRAGRWDQKVDGLITENRVIGRKEQI